MAKKHGAYSSTSGLSAKEKAEISRQKSRINAVIRRAKKRGYIFGSNPFSAYEGSAAALKQIRPADIYAQAKYWNPYTNEIISGTERRAQERSIAARKAARMTKLLADARRIYKAALEENPLDYAAIKRDYERTKELVRAKVELGDVELATRIDMLTHSNDLDNILANIKHKIDNWEGRVEWTVGDDKAGKGETFTKVKERDKDHLKSLLDNAIATEGVEVVARRLEASADQANILAEQILYGGSGSSQDSHAYMQGELAQFAQLLKGRELALDEKMELEQQIESFMPA